MNRIQPNKCRTKFIFVIGSLTFSYHYGNADLSQVKLSMTLSEVGLDFDFMI